MNNVTENFHLEQQRTKYSYQVGAASNTIIWGLEVDAGDDASVVRRRARAMGPGAFLHQLALPSHIDGIPLNHYLGSPTRTALGNMSCSSAVGRTLDVA